jgi:hypothetical protein
MQKANACFKKWLPKTGNDFIPFVNVPLFADFAYNTWWINSDATVHVTNC